MRLRVGEAVVLEHGAEQFVIESEHFVEEFAVFNVVRLGARVVATCGEVRVGAYHLVLLDILEPYEFILPTTVLLLCTRCTSEEPCVCAGTSAGCGCRFVELTAGLGGGLRGTSG